MLILLSSGARRRYRDDILRALAHPAGTELRFRYGKNYIANEVIADARANVLSGREALICHLAQQPNGKPAFVVPCRFVSVARSELVGSSLILTLSAGQYVQQLDDATLRSAMTPEELTLIPDQGPADRSPPGLFAFPIAAPLIAAHAPVAASAGAFESTAEGLRAAGFGVGGATISAGSAEMPPEPVSSPPASAELDEPLAFYMVRKLVEIGSKLDNVETAIVANNGRYRLRSGTRYAVEVYTYSPGGDVKPSEASTLTIAADDSDVKFSSETEAKLDSRYDLNRFRFTSEERLMSLPTGLKLALGVPSNRDGKTVVEERCDITLELLFAGSWTLAAARIALIAVGTAAPAIIGAYAAQKGSLGLAALMFLAALATGIGTVVPAWKKS